MIRRMACAAPSEHAWDAAMPKSHRAEPLSWRALRHARKARKRQRRAAQPRLPGHAAADVSELRDPAYWRRLCPELHVADEDWCAAHMEPAALSAARREELQQDLRNQGFFILSPEELRWDEPPMRALCAAAAALRAHGWPATLLLMYDEAWWVCNRLSDVMRGVSGNANCFDILAWCVSAAAGESGFAPHRDRQPVDVPGSFRSDGSPRYTTAWVALSEASARTGCLYLLPSLSTPGTPSVTLPTPTPTLSTWRFALTPPCRPCARATWTRAASWPSPTA